MRSIFNVVGATIATLVGNLLVEVPCIALNVLDHPVSVVVGFAISHLTNISAASYFNVVRIFPDCSFKLEIFPQSWKDLQYLLPLNGALILCGAKSYSLL